MAAESVRVSRPGRSDRRLPTPASVVTSFWRHRHLIFSLAKRDVLGRYRGSSLGLLWALLSPVLQLATFTFVFGTIFESRWDVELRSKGEFALLLFAGLVVFFFFADCINRAPGLVFENVSYVKRVVFPLEILPWVASLSGLFQAALNTLVLLAAYLLVVGLPPWTALAIPLLFVPLTLVVTGLSWFLASIGVYLRDVRQFVPVLTTLVMFLCPIFYPLAAVPESFRHWIGLNPLAWIVEQTRGALFFARAPSPAGLVVATAVGWTVAWLGLAWFARTRRGFADVV